MALVTPTEVRSASKTYRTGILFQSDSDLTSLIAICQEDLERRTGGIFDEQSITEKVINHNSRLIQLGHYPVKTVDTLELDGDVYSLEDEELEESTGSILLESKVITAPYMYEVTYTTDAPEDVNLAKDVLCRMVLDKIKNRESTVETDIKRLTRTYIGAI